MGFMFGALADAWSVRCAEMESIIANRLSAPGDPLLVDSFEHHNRTLFMRQCGGALYQRREPLRAVAPGQTAANLIIWMFGTASEMVMYIGGILGTILIVALIIFLVRRS